MKKEVINSFILVSLLVLSGLMGVFLHNSAQATYTDFTSHKLIIIDHNYIDEDIANHSFWVYNISEDFKDSDHSGSIQPDGDDIAFFSYDNGTQYKHTLEIYNGTIGKIGAWVNISDTVTASSNFQFWIYYGDADGLNQEDITGTWGSNYHNVWLMYDASGHLQDSHANNADTTSETGITYLQDVFSGGYGLEFDGEDNTGAEFPSTAHFTNGSNDFSVEALVNCTVIGSEKQRIVQFYDNSYYYMSFYSSADIGGTSVRTAIHTKTQVHYSDVVNNTWYHIVFTYSNISGSNLYVNGILRDTNSSTGTNYHSADNFIGREGYKGYYQGNMDYIIAYDKELSYNEVNMSWDNINDTANFFTFDPPQYPPNISSPYPTNESTCVNVSTSTFNVTIEDSEGDTFNWSIDTSPDVGNSSGTDASNGSKECTLDTPLPYHTTITVYVNITGYTGTSPPINRTYTFTTWNRKPSITGTTPTNETGNVSVTTSHVYAVMIDPDGDTYNWSIEVSTGDNNTGDDNGNGTRSCSLTTPLEYNTTYTFWVNFTGYSGCAPPSNETFVFTTIKNMPPVITAYIPGDGETSINHAITNVSINITDAEGDAFSYTINVTRAPGGIASYGNVTGTGETDGTKYCNVSGLDYNQWYYVVAEITSYTGNDTVSNQTFTFKTLARTSAEKFDWNIGQLAIAMIVIITVSFVVVLMMTHIRVYP